MHCQQFFPSFNDQHRHTGLALHTPADIHYGTAEIAREKRAARTRCRVRRPPGTLRQKAAAAAHAPSRNMDQPA